MAIDREYYEKRISKAKEQLANMLNDLDYIKKYLPSIYNGRLREIKKCENRIAAYEKYLNEAAVQ